MVVSAVVAMVFRFLLSRSSNGNDSNKTEVLTVKLTAAIEALTDNMRDLKTEMTSHAQENRAGFQHCIVRGMGGVVKIVVVAADRITDIYALFKLYQYIAHNIRILRLQPVYHIAYIKKFLTG